MTVIAFRDGILASDSLVQTERGVQSGFARKIIRCRGDVLAGASGAASSCSRFLEWAAVNRIKPFIPDEDDKELDGVLFYPDGRVAYYDSNGGPDFIEAPFHATGIGGEIAKGAMAHGATSEEAVRYAIELSGACGGEVLTLRFVGARRRKLRSSTQPKRGRR